MAEKSLPVSVRLPAEIKVALEQAATEDARSMSSMIERILTAWLVDHRYISAQASGAV